MCVKYVEVAQLLAEVNKLGIKFPACTVHRNIVSYIVLFRHN